MDTTIVTTTLTDGSKVYAVAFADREALVTIDCVDLPAALALQSAFSVHAIQGNIDAH